MDQAVGCGQRRRVPWEGPIMQVIDLCRSCGHERASHDRDGERCGESTELLVDEVGVEAAIRCDCPGWPGR